MKSLFIPHVNLIPDEYSAKRYRVQWTNRWIASAVITAFVAGIPGLYIGGSAVLTDSSMSGQIANANQELMKNNTEIPLLQSQLQQLEAEQEVLSLVRDRIEWRDLFAVLVDAAGNDVRFQRLSAVGAGVEGDGVIEIRIHGLAPSQTVAREYVVELEHTKVFDNLELINTSRVVIESIEMIEFHVLMEIDGGLPRERGSENAG